MCLELAEGQRPEKELWWSLFDVKGEKEGGKKWGLLLSGVG